MAQKPAIRVRFVDGKPRQWKELHTALGGQTFVRVHAQPGNVEFVLTVDSSKQLDALREKLAAAGVEEIVGGDTSVATPASRTAAQRPGTRSQGHGARQQNRAEQQRGRGGHGGRGARDDKLQLLPGKPYGFVALAPEFPTATPVWHDGSVSGDRLSGEVRFELETLTPLLVGWEQSSVADGKGEWPVPQTLPGVGQLSNRKTVLCPLRAPWGLRPVVIPGDALKGLLRHELGALLGAPMERVAERSYSYRPNAMFAQGAQLIPRIARVPSDGIEMQALDSGAQVRVPIKLELLPTNLRYDKQRRENANYYRFDDGGAPYRGGQGAGERLNSKRHHLHKTLAVNPEQPTETVGLPQSVQKGYLATLGHLLDTTHGHFSERHPDVPKIVTGNTARARILKAAKDEVFQPGDLIWVEWDTEKKQIVSLGWHYYYRWAYVDTVRKQGGRLERRGLFPLNKEREKEGDAPAELSLVRRLLGYSGDNEGSAGIGENDHAQLMGRVFVNSALEVIGESESDEKRFLKPTFLKELGMPRPSAVEHYLKQPYHPESRPSDKAALVTYGDAADYDKPGELAGRKFYLDRPGAVAEDPSDTNRQNERSTLALEASKPGRKFRFTLRFRDLDAAELAAILIALSPDQFKSVLGGTHQDGYCSKLGYARPLGWGSVRIEAKALLLLDKAGDLPTLNPEADLTAWVSANHRASAMQDEWLAIHRRKHPDAADYPTRSTKSGETIPAYHTHLRTEHSRQRRYRSNK